MTLEIQGQIEVKRNWLGLIIDSYISDLAFIINAAILSTSIIGLEKLLNSKPPVRHFFIYYGGSHVAVHGLDENGQKSERILFIT